MKISAIETYMIILPLVQFFETSFGRTTERRIILVGVVDGDGAEGWGECTAGEGPFYCEEWTAGASSVIKTYPAPMTLGQEVESASQISSLMNKVRGNRMAKAAIETACWSLEAKRSRRGEPLLRRARPALDTRLILTA